MQSPYCLQLPGTKVYNTDHDTNVSTRQLHYIRVLFVLFFVNISIVLQCGIQTTRDRMLQCTWNISVYCKVYIVAHDAFITTIIFTVIPFQSHMKIINT